MIMAGWSNLITARTGVSQGISVDDRLMADADTTTLSRAFQLTQEFVDFCGSVWNVGDGAVACADPAMVEALVHEWGPRVKKAVDVLPYVGVVFAMGQWSSLENDAKRQKLKLMTSYEKAPSEQHLSIRGS